MTQHTHDDRERLVFGCPACIERRAADQRRAKYAVMSDADLYDSWVTDPCGEDDSIIAQMLMERGGLTPDEVDVLYENGVLS